MEARGLGEAQIWIVITFERTSGQYLSARPTYTEEQFCRRFRMRKVLFLEIVAKLRESDAYFTCRKDCTGKFGVHPDQKSTVIESENKFITSIIQLYRPHNLRLASRDDLINILQVNAARGFPGMIGSIDCMKWSWKTVLALGEGSSKDTTVVLEAEATADLHTWHAFSTWMNTPPNSRIKLTGTNTIFYYLADGIYPEW
ncbi:LOW QUALITY PROTEIN: Transposon protein [Phytophthora megakarya]|uniref:Transposon protein n=1 Tax=Phytophthora megakarya TaxID=4795 RepID=A0A225WWT0_9STRA|nr:LOW QUALITY PROTEIN: Transposon protein [Phytophthora megakarya]